jgi:hypothetical protein
MTQADMNDVAHIIEKGMTGLGHTSAMVAGTLISKGFVGTIEDPSDCPLARYLKTRIPGGWAVNVSGEEIWFRKGQDGEIGTVKTTAAIAEFVVELDNEKYPGLIDRLTYHV